LLRGLGEGAKVVLKFEAFLVCVGEEAGGSVEMDVVEVRRIPAKESDGKLLPVKKLDKMPTGVPMTVVAEPGMVASSPAVEVGRKALRLEVEGPKVACDCMRAVPVAAAANRECLEFVGPVAGTEAVVRCRLATCKEEVRYECVEKSAETKVCEAQPVKRDVLQLVRTGGKDAMCRMRETVENVLTLKE